MRLKGKWSDAIQMIASLSVLRVYNICLVFVSYYISRFKGKAKQLGYPLSISVEPTTSCNLRCPECPSGLRNFTRPTGMLTTETFKRIIDQLYKRTWYLVFYFQGEPYLHPDFLELVRHAKQRKIYTATSTNAHYLTSEKAKLTVESGLSRIIISIDGTTQETYSQYRVGGNLKKVIEGTKNLVHWKRELKSSTPHIIFQFLVVKPNEHQLNDVKQLGKELGVDEVLFKSAQVYDYEDGNALITDNIKYSRYRKKPDGSYEIKNKLLNHCWRMWQSCVFTWDGQVVPCCFDKDADHPMGNINQMDFKSIWFGKSYQKFRSQLMKGRSEIDICKNCSEGTEVWLD